MSSGESSASEDITAMCAYKVKATVIFKFTFPALGADLGWPNDICGFERS
jgi:hypothetical protein